MAKEFQEICLILMYLTKEKKINLFLRYYIFLVGDISSFIVVEGKGKNICNGCVIARIIEGKKQV